MDRALIAAARGDRKLDLAIENVRLVNVFTGEIYASAVGIVGQTIVHVNPPGETELAAENRFDAGERLAVPGLIDTHLHIESSMLAPPQFAEAVLPHGTTTVVIDPHEIGNVLGVDGVRYMVEASRDLDLRVLTLVPSCVPAAPGLETSGADFDAETVERMLGWDGVHGLAEVMNYPGVINAGQRMLSILEANQRSGGIVQGHAPGLTGRALSAYLVAGPNSDHETRTADEALEKLRSGMVVEARESSISQDVAEVAKAVAGKGYLPNVCLCTDDIEAHDLLNHGHLDHVLRRAVEEGIDPVNAVRYATLNAAQRIERRDLGAIAPGRTADVVLLEDLDPFTVTDVFCGGKQVVESGRLCAAQRGTAAPDHFFNTLHLREIQAEDFRLKLDGMMDGAGRLDAGVHQLEVRVIDYAGPVPLQTEFRKVSLPVENGELRPEAYQGRDGPLNRIAVFERHGKGGSHSLGLLAGFGLQEGALASTVAHDSHNLVVAGIDPHDMAMAARAVKEAGGGLAVVVNGKVASQVSLPLAGLMTPESAETVAPKLERMLKTLAELGIPGRNPLLRISTLALPVIPSAKISDRGLVDVDNQRLLPLVVET